MHEDATNGLPRALLRAIEDELIAADPQDVMAGADASNLAVETQSIVMAALGWRHGAVERSRPAARRSGRWTPPAAPARQRVALRELLVASPRARDIAGQEVSDQLSDQEIDALIQRMIDAGLLPHIEDK